MLLSITRTQCADMTFITYFSSVLFPFHNGNMALRVLYVRGIITLPK